MDTKTAWLNDHAAFLFRRLVVLVRLVVLGILEALVVLDDYFTSAPLAL
jgi:hypothetical protein